MIETRYFCDRCEKEISAFQSASIDIEASFIQEVSAQIIGHVGNAELTRPITRYLFEPDGKTSTLLCKDCIIKFKKTFDIFMDNKK